MRVLLVEDNLWSENPFRSRLLMLLMQATG
jgi:hypothetical protein